MFLKLLLTAGIIVAWARLWVWLSFLWGGQYGHLDAEDDKETLKWAHIKGGLQWLLITALALLGLALVWDWIAL